APAAEYTITARNMAVAATKTLVIEVLPGPPSPPVEVRAVAKEGSATVSWQPGFEGASPITGYTVTVTPGNDTCVTDAETTECDFTGLKYGKTYTFTVQASNAQGTGPAAVATATLDHWASRSGGT